MLTEFVPVCRFRLTINPHKYQQEVEPKKFVLLAYFDDDSIGRPQKAKHTKSHESSITVRGLKLITVSNS